MALMHAVHALLWVQSPTRFMTTSSSQQQARALGTQPTECAQATTGLPASACLYRGGGSSFQGQQTRGRGLPKQAVVYQAGAHSPQRQRQKQRGQRWQCRQSARHQHPPPPRPLPRRSERARARTQQRRKRQAAGNDLGAPPPPLCPRCLLRPAAARELPASQAKQQRQRSRNAPWLQLRLTFQKICR